jgi:hypothetical protein
VELIKGQSAPEVWLAAVEHLAGSPGMEDFDVFLHVAQPTALSMQDKAVYDEVDAFLKAHGAFSLHTVAETIFPLDEYLHSGAQGVFKDYPTKIRAIQRAREDGRQHMSTPRDGRQRAALAFTRIAASHRGSGGRYNGLNDSPLVRKVRATRDLFGAD